MTTVKKKPNPVHKKPVTIKAKPPSSQPTDTEYIQLFKDCEIPNKSKLSEVNHVIEHNINPNKTKYQRISALANYSGVHFDKPNPKLLPFSPLDINGGKIPWYFIACIHYLECSFSMKLHLHNGDPLTNYTVRVPANRPDKKIVNHDPPFTFEESAVDAMIKMGYNKVNSWSLPLILRYLEKYNGFGYNAKNVKSPYLWGYSNLYTSGKYVADHKFDATAVSKQMGAAVILKQMEKKGLIIIPRL
jgi:lysozyme family protein